MRRWTALTALTAVMTGSALAPGPAAFASTTTTTPTRVCSKEVGGRVLRLYAYAVYEENAATVLRDWTSFHYMVTGGELAHSSNNVNIRLTESGNTRYAYNSPDALRFNTWYHTAPATPVLTSVWGPSGEHDHRANDHLRFTGIFDSPGLPDQSCTTEDWV